jgi:ABC-type sugar transport system permease subunit
LTCEAKSDARWALLFVAPALAAMALFVVWPLTRAIMWSMSDADLLAPRTGRFVGLANYREVLTDQRFQHAFLNTALFSLMVVPVQTTAAFFLALLTNRPEPLWRWLRGVFFAGLIVSMPVLAVVWSMLYQPAQGGEAGLINSILIALHLQPRAWLTDPGLALPAIALMSIWQGVGYQMMVFRAGLMSISRDLIDASRVDGAGSLSRLRHVVLPAMRNSIIFNIVVTTILAFRLFVQPYLMTHGGPRDRTLSLIQWVYESTFLRYDLGRASAGALLFLLLVGLLTLVQRLLLKEERA